MVLQKLEELLAQTPFLAGLAPGLADYAIMPFIRQFANTDKDWFMSSRYVRLAAWLEGLLSGPHFPPIMKIYCQHVVITSLFYGKEAAN